MTFDPATLDQMRTTEEIGIRVGRLRPVTIWVVVADGAPYVRSVRGARGKWFVAARAAGRATLDLAGRQIPVRITTIDDDAATQAAVSQAFLTKYARSPYAQSIVAPATLPTTVRLDPG